MMSFRSVFIILPVAILCAMLLNACNKKQKDAAQKDNSKNLLIGDTKTIDFYDYDYILVGSYGGFTGGKKMHRIDADGTIQAIRQMKSQSPTDTLKAYKLPKSKNKQLRKDVKESHIADTTLDDPGNMTFFITLGKGNAEHTIRWGNKKDALPDNVKKLHNILLAHCIKE